MVLTEYIRISCLRGLLQQPQCQRRGALSNRAANSVGLDEYTLYRPCLPSLASANAVGPRAQSPDHSWTPPPTQLTSTYSEQRVRAIQDQSVADARAVRISARGGKANALPPLRPAARALCAPNRYQLLRALAPRAHTHTFAARFPARCCTQI